MGSIPLPGSPVWVLEGILGFMLGDAFIVNLF